MKRYQFFGRPGGPFLTVFPTDGPKCRPPLFPCGWLGEPSPPFSQAEDSMQASGSEYPMPGTARPRVRIREHRPGFTR
jgi:hypothetical protein